MSRESVTCVAAMPWLLQLLRQLFLGADALAADQLQNLALPVGLGHMVISFSRWRGFGQRRGHRFGPVPPGISRDFMPCCGIEQRAPYRP